MTLDHLRAPDTPIAIIGLGYVGLPLAVEFGQHRPVIGYDIKPERIAELQAGHDSTRETTSEALAAGSKWNFLPFRPGLVGGHCIGVDPADGMLRASPTRPSPAATTRR
jgi:UDP-N-acetyl-D-mannosaminuronate dehydrogenase